MIEKDVENYLVARIEQMGGACLKLRWLGGVGFPDRTILLPGGRIAFVELKRPRGGRIGPGQNTWQVWLIDLGFRCERIKTLDGVDKFVCSL